MDAGATISSSQEHLAIIDQRVLIPAINEINFVTVISLSVK